MNDARQHSPACERNREPLLKELREHLADARHVWEIGSGTGQHAVFFSRHLPHLIWQPSDRPEYHASIEAWRSEAALPNLASVLTFDLFDATPPLETTDAIVACNVIHIAPFEATACLFAHARTSLSPGGKVILYGPFMHEDHDLEPSNQRFDQMLRQRDPRSGIRRLQDVDAEARACGFERALTRRMPANNDLLIFERPF
ncbi:DUF938 domain-containing protein [Bradymonadaceae bacterium TMQ3]|uniref:DUF938 domain-containing protein n=1 Tax=Lujinxingia sediminis TaxID=2480984 RepID=A0ABY0CTC4_9DELT|nr:DUF938 domain-containing protein [Lujinxingia sediminis]RDV38595.1 DUF938 domain-containing protein [Bradymonadaceae bacterium TMQ3]RVU44855.1 DUF938 domain-containing protein [Lujinxingia sediminis]TXC76634.1 DUF938 domain-containing protein [Bradymonadales bacterium TMQ1]